MEVEEKIEQCNAKLLQYKEQDDYVHPEAEHMYD